MATSAETLLAPLVSDSNPSRPPWRWIGTTYFAEGVPATVIATLSVVFFKSFGTSNADIALYVSALVLPWSLKPLWSPLLEAYRANRDLVVATEIALAVGLLGIALSLSSEHRIALCVAFLGVIAFCAATHDMAVDGLYIGSLSAELQARYLGWLSVAFNAAKLAVQGGLVVLAGALAPRLGVVFGWQIIFGLLGVIMASLALYHLRWLPAPDPRTAATGVPATARDVVVTFFRKSGVAQLVALVVLYRLGEGQLVRIVPLFLLDSVEQGGAGLSTAQLGGLYGVLGACAFMLGALLGGRFAAALGLHRSLVPLCVAFNLPASIYFLLAWLGPQAPAAVAAAIVSEQVLYGMGFVGLKLIMMQSLAAGPYQTAHFSFAAGLSGIGAAAAGMLSAPLQAWLGYSAFFGWILISAVPAVVLSSFCAQKGEQMDQVELYAPVRAPYAPSLPDAPSEAGRGLNVPALRDQFLNVALLLLSLLVGLLFIEVFLRWRHPVAVPIYETDPHLLYRLIPGGHHRFVPLPGNGAPVLVKVNAEGFRGAGFAADKRGRRVVVYGDSFVEAQYSPLEESFVSQLEREMRTRLGQADLEVINAGVSGYGPDQAALKLEEEVERLAPDAVVFCLFTGNDFGDLLRNKLFKVGDRGDLVENHPRLSDEMVATFEEARRLGDRPMVLRAAHAAVETLSAPAPPKAFPSYIEDSLANRQREHRAFIESASTVENLFWDGYDADIALDPESPSARLKVQLMNLLLERLDGRIHEYGIPWLLVVIPDPVDVAGADFELHVDADKYENYDPRRLTQVVVRSATDHGIAHVNLFDSLRERPGERLFFRFGDNHWNASGQAKAAKVVAHALARRGWLGTGSQQIAEGPH